MTPQRMLAKVLEAYEDGDTEREAALWLTEIEDQPLWELAERWCGDRWALAMAASEGYTATWDEVLDYVADQRDEHGTPEFERKDRVAVYRYPDGTWLAFEEAPPYAYKIDGDEDHAHTYLWRQLDENPLARPCEAADTLRPDPLGPDATDPALFGEPDDEHDHAPGLSTMLTAECACGSRTILPLESWLKRPDRLCMDCKTRCLVVTPCGTTDDKATADGFGSRPDTPSWTCDLCHHEAVLHVGNPSYEVDGRGGDQRLHGLRCTAAGCKCGDFHLPEVVEGGSQCSKCGFEVPWTPAQSGRPNACLACASVGTLRPISGPATGDRVLCEACVTATATRRYLKPSKTSQIMHACDSCARDSKVSGRGKRHWEAL